MLVFKQQGKIRKASIFASTVDNIPHLLFPPPFKPIFLIGKKSVLRETTEFFSTSETEYNFLFRGSKMTFEDI